MGVVDLRRLGVRFGVLDLRFGVRLGVVDLRLGVLVLRLGVVDLRLGVLALRLGVRLGLLDESDLLGVRRGVMVLCLVE